MAEDAVNYEPQSDEERDEALSRANPGRQTATGQAKLEHEGKLERPKKADRGSPNKIAGGQPKPTSKNPKPQGLQKKEAKFATNGTLRHGMVATPSGPQPASGLSARADGAERLMHQQKERTAQERQRKKGSYDALTDMEISNLSPNELRAIGSDRGYAIPQGGARSVRRRFSDAQAKDSRLVGNDEATSEVKSSNDTTETHKQNQKRSESGYEGEYKTKFASPEAESEAREAGLTDADFEGWTPEKDDTFSVGEVREIRDEDQDGD